MAGTASPVALAPLLRRRDRDRYLTTLFAPADRRDALVALYAFNHELARIREAVREPMLGRIRLQWWRETVDAIYAGRPVRRHEVALPLAEAIRRYDLTRYHLDRLIDAREQDLAEAPPASLAALEAYAEASSVPLVWLALEVLGQRAGAAALAGREVGLAHALAGLLSAVPFHARLRRSILPADLAAEAGLAEGAVFELTSPPALRRVVERLAAVARGHLGAARASAGTVPRAALPALLPAVLAERHLARLERAGWDPFDARAAIPDGGTPWRLAWAALRRRY